MVRLDGAQWRRRQAPAQQDLDRGAAEQLPGRPVGAVAGVRIPVGVIVHRVPPRLGVGAAVGGVQQRPQRIRRRRLHRGQRLPRPPQQLPQQRRVVLPHVGQVRVDVRSVGVGVAPWAAASRRRAVAAGPVSPVRAVVVGGVVPAVHAEEAIAVNVPIGPLAIVSCRGESETSVTNGREFALAFFVFTNAMRITSAG